jgi:hypothetical protein
LACFKLKDNLEFSPAESPSDELIPIFELLVSADLEIRKETFNSFIESDVMSREFVVLEVILKI